MASKVLCITRNCNNWYTPLPDADTHDRNYCPACLSKEFLSLKNLSLNTKGYARPAGKRRKSKTKKNKTLMMPKIRKKHVFKTILEMDW